MGYPKDGQENHDKNHEGSEVSYSEKKRKKRPEQAQARAAGGNRRDFSGIKPEKAKEMVWSSAGRMIAAKDWPEIGLRDRLREKFRGMPGIEEISEEVARRMAALGIVDDDRFARGFLRQRLARKSKNLSAREALAKGISQETVDRAIGEIEAEREPELEKSGLTLDQAALERLWLSKFGAPPADEKERMRQGRFLAGRGFSFGAIQDLWKKAKNGEIGEMGDE